jgi:hypothetical protein
MNENYFLHFCIVYLRAKALCEEYPIVHSLATAFKPWFRLIPTTQRALALK